MPLFLSLIVMLGLLQSPAHAEEATDTPRAHIKIQSPYAFATMPGGVTGAAFMTIENTGDLDDTLISVESNIAEFTEIHENFIDPDDGIMMMRKIKNISIPADGQAILNPKGKHVMLIKLDAPLTLDSTFPITLIFEKSGKKEINIKVVQPGTVPNTKHDMHHHQH